MTVELLADSELGTLPPFPLDFVPNNLRNVGEEISGYFDPCCLNPDVPLLFMEGGLDFGELDSDMLSGSDTAAALSRSRSPCPMLMGLERPEPTLDGSLSLEAVPPVDLPPVPESILLVLDR